ncbi:glycerophosphodiester phosphodiesterase family protein [Vibrio sp. B1Z05]|uniref:glycerophosphodiester phosphodiesterase n=1 Tax=Vibrio sp. B1Z05 TaxID=2654980 RepID=UPI00128D7BCA|nr:glycerophosphodiester phosphodiesterase family protein [Vibrio sp. B1Z05]MPW35821.1 hypothetical protein [Vibrio sp. B1Z05]
MKKLPRFVGHRGTREQRPENTKEAFDYVYALKPAFEALGSSVSFEFDVRLTKDNIPVLIHDESLWRTAGILTLVSELTYLEMKAISFNDHMKYHPGTLITLAEMFDYYPDVVFDAEIKEKGERGILLADIFIALINQYDAAHRMIMHIPCIETSMYALEHFPKGCRFELPGSLIEDFQTKVYHGNPTAKSEGYHQMCMEFRGMISNEVIDYVQPKFVENARNLGYPIVTFWENRSVSYVDEDILHRAVKLGVDSVIVDDVLQTLKVFANIVASDNATNPK